MGNRKRLKTFLETWKPLHLCWWFEKHGWEIPRYFIGGGSKPPVYASGNIDNANRNLGNTVNTPVADWDKTNDFIVAIALEAQSGANMTNTNCRLEWRNKTDSGTFAVFSGSGELQLGATDLVEGNSLDSGEAICTPVNGTTYVAGSPNGGIEKETGSTFTVGDGSTANQWSEFQISVDASNALDSKEYEFRVYDVDNSVVLGPSLATLTTAAGVEDLEVVAFDLPTIEENLAPKENLGPISLDDDISIIEFVGGLIAGWVTVKEWVKVEIGEYDLEINVFDLPTVEENLTPEENLGPISPFDKIALIEFLDLLKDILPDIFDNPTIIENINARLSGLPINVFDLPTIIEDITLSLSISPVEINVNDQLTITEFKAGLIAGYITVKEWVQVQTGTGDLSVSVSDLLTIIENIQVEKDSDISVSVSDFLTIIEGTYAVSDIGLDVTVAEFVQLGIGAEGLGINVYDSPTIEESLTPLENLGPISKEEQLRIAEYLSLLKDILPDKYELLTIQEIITMALEGAAPQVDAHELATIAEYIAMSMPIKMSVYESITLQETISHLLDIIPSVYESLTVSEYVALLQEILVGAVDEINVSEYVNVAMVLATGLMSVTFTARKPNIEFAGRKPDIIFTGSGG
jgi:hypothetical protein